jgi:hypothetical protein
MGALRSLAMVLHQNLQIFVFFPDGMGYQNETTGFPEANTSR